MPELPAVNGDISHQTEENRLLLGSVVSFLGLISALSHLLFNPS